jgi:hypothetical protein
MGLVSIQVCLFVTSVARAKIFIYVVARMVPLAKQNDILAGLGWS